MKDVMIDLETFGTRHDAMIVQIGACYFDRETGEIGEVFKANIEYNMAAGDKFTVDYRTISWWITQDHEARASIVTNPQQLSVVLSALVSFLQKGGESVSVWSHATFDMPILRNALEAYGLEMPMSFRNMRDIRTVMDLADYVKDRHTLVARTGTHHDALDDAKFQAKYVSEAINAIRCNHAKERA